MSFEQMQDRLLTIARERVGNGEITESQLARLAGISQSHIHNVLKGARKLSPELADELLLQLRLDTEDLRSPCAPTVSRWFCPVPLLSGRLGREMGSFQPHRTTGSAQVPMPVLAGVGQPLAARLGEDCQVAPRFQPDDLVLIDRAMAARRKIVPADTYVVMTAWGPRLRYVRQGFGRLYLVSENSVVHPSQWEPAVVSRRAAFTVVLGRVVWVSRELANAFDG